jgi:hypothetical protein
LRSAYLFTLWLFTSNLLDEFENLILRFRLCVCKDLLVDRAVIFDNNSNVSSNVVYINERRWVVSAADDIVICECQAAIELSGGDARECNLVPPADINYCVREIDTLNMVEDLLFLWCDDD